MVKKNQQKKFRKISLICVMKTISSAFIHEFEAEIFWKIIFSAIDKYLCKWVEPLRIQGKFRPNFLGLQAELVEKSQNMVPVSVGIWKKFLFPKK